jgi:hypothetical protein
MWGGGRTECPVEEVEQTKSDGRAQKAQKTSHGDNDKGTSIEHTSLPFPPPLPKTKPILTDKGSWRSRMSRTCHIMRSKNAHASSF